MVRRLFCVFLLVFLLSSLGSAQQNATVAHELEPGLIRVAYIDIEIDTSGMVYVTEELVTGAGDIVNRLVPNNIQGVEVLDGETVLSSELTPRDGRQVLSFVPEEDGRKQAEIVVKYSSQGFTGKSGETWSINYSSIVTPLGSAPQGTIIRLYTPKNTQITNIDYKDLYWSPVGDSEIWVYPLSEEFNLSFSYKLGVSGPLIPRPTSTTLGPADNSTGLPVESAIRNYVVPFIAFLAFLLVVLWTLLFKKKSKDRGRKDSREAPPEEERPLAVVKDTHHISDVSIEGGDLGHDVDHDVVPNVEYSMKPAEKVRKVKDSVKNVLDETEKRIIGILEGFDEETTQAFIYKSTGIPKSSLSDAIRRLEKRNIIERKKEGRTNWLKLKDTIFE